MSFLSLNWTLLRRIVTVFLWHGLEHPDELAEEFTRFGIDLLKSFIRLGWLWFRHRRGAGRLLVPIAFSVNSSMSQRFTTDQFSRWR